MGGSVSGPGSNRDPTEDWVEPSLCRIVRLGNWVVGLIGLRRPCAVPFASNLGDCFRPCWYLLSFFKGVGCEIPCRITHGLGTPRNPAGPHTNLALLVVLRNLQNQVPDLRERCRSQRFKQRAVLFQERVVNALGSCSAGRLVIFHGPIPIRVEDPLVCLVFYFVFF